MPITKLKTGVIGAIVVASSTDFLFRETVAVMGPLREAFRAAHNGQWPGQQLPTAALRGNADLKSLPRDQIKFIGIEKLTRDNLRDVVAPGALRKLKDGP